MYRSPNIGSVSRIVARLLIVAALALAGCSKDSPTNTNCGDSKIDCAALPGVETAECVSGACKARSCMANYSLKDDQCEIQCDAESCAPGNVAASTDDLDVVRLSWTAPTSSLRPTGYQILRDGNPLAEVGPNALSYDDATAPAGEITAGEITLNASQETSTEGIELTWNAPVLTQVAGASMTYVVAAVYSSTSSKGSAQVQGNRALPSVQTIIYELSRDEGAWIEIGEETHYLDESAPMGELIPTGEATARADHSRGIIVLELSSTSVVSEQTLYNAQFLPG